MTDRRSFSHAIAEGDGISVIASVDDPAGARSAEEQRAEALLVRADPRASRCPGDAAEASRRQGRGRG